MRIVFEVLKKIVSLIKKIENETNVWAGKGQNVENQNVESPKRTSKIRTSKVIFRLSTFFSMF
jgi:hypothetical protein